MQKIILKTNAQKRFEKAVENIDSIEMFSKRGWKKLNKEIEKLGVVRYSTPELLSDGFQCFLEIWLDDNNFNVDIFNYEKEGDLFVYFEEGEGRDLISDVNLEKVLIDRFSEYLLGD